MSCGIWQRNFGGLLPLHGFGGWGGWGGCGGGCGGFGSTCDQKSGAIVSAIRAGVISGDFDLDKTWY
jgi:hypothetical protein